MKSQLTFKRYELKYRIHRKQMEKIRSAMSAHMRPDEYGESLIQSLYLDTPDGRLIRRSLEHPAYKEKLRLRCYGVADENSPVFLELKKKYDSVVYKRRLEMKEQEAMRYLSGGDMQQDTQIAREIDYAMGFYKNLAPRVMIQCHREAFCGKDDREFRVTFDDRLMWRDYDLTLTTGHYGNELILPDEVLMEVKTAGAIPLWMTALLTQLKIYKTSFSKYGTAYQLINQKGEFHYDRFYFSEPLYGNDHSAHHPRSLPALYRGSVGHRSPALPAVFR